MCCDGMAYGTNEKSVSVEPAASVVRIYKDEGSIILRNFDNYLPIKGLL
jgi:hypothetical protein